MITLKTLPQATEQEVFDQVSKHLLTQMRKSTLEGQPNCVYRSGTLSCAAGCLIGEDEYSGDFEGESWHALTKWKLVPSAHEQLISLLQEVHDFNEPQDWLYKLAQLAEARNLAFNPEVK